MATPAITRTSTKRAAAYEDKGEISGWALKFAYETKEGNTPQNVSVSGSKDGGKFFTLNTSPNNNVSCSFTNATFDAGVVSNVIDECNAILAGNYSDVDEGV